MVCKKWDDYIWSLFVYYEEFFIKVIYAWKGDCPTNLLVQVLQIVNIGDDIDLNRFMIHFIDLCS